MAPPDVGTEYSFRVNGRVTSHNEDGTFNVKFDSKPGRPHKKSLNDVVPPSLPLMEALLPAMNGDEKVASERASRPSRRRWIGWAFCGATVGGGIAAGIFHGLGTKLFELLWSRVAPLLLQ
jgi:hypothetical protein